MFSFCQNNEMIRNWCDILYIKIRLEEGENFRAQPRDEWPEGGEEAASPYILFGPHGYRTFPHSGCQEVPVVEVELGEVEGDWFLQEYVNSHDGKPFGPNQPYLCPESRLSISTNIADKEHTRKMQK